MRLIQEAAQLRAAGVSANVDRPKQRRSFERQGAAAWVSTRAVNGLQLRSSTDGSGPLQFAGMASVTEAPYEMWDMFGPYTEVVSQGAFDQTLRTPNLDVPLVLGHDQMRRIARTTNGTLQLSATQDGLDVQAQLDPSNPEVQYITPMLESGLIDEMSFAFQITSGVWSPDYTEFRIDAVDIQRGDVSIVGYGANPATAGSGLRARKLSDEELRAEVSRRGLDKPADAAGMTRARALALLDLA